MDRGENGAFSFNVGTIFWGDRDAEAKTGCRGAARGGVCVRGGRGGAAGVKIGYIEVERVFEKYQKTLDLNEKLQQERKEKIAARKTMVRRRSTR